MIRTRRLRRRLRLLAFRTYWFLSGQDIKVGKKANIEWGAVLKCEGGGSIRIGDRCRVHRGAQLLTFGGNIRIGNDFSVNPYSVLEGQGGLDIGDSVLIAPHVVIVPANHGTALSAGTIRSQPQTKQGITIGNDVWLGAGARILDGVNIADGCVIGAGAVLTKSTEKHYIYIGVPAEQYRERT
ncbi:acyltransferase [Breoghania sp.]|uniref:acyltransferase n=1 Tax=Breoghania sp. TaxID=2065378 RepID=UPI002AA9502E|nr:acyltransferase [Breoghania sp.]